MFKNSVFKFSVNTKKWAKATLVRCVRTFATSMVSLLPTSAVALGEINWAFCLSASATATVVIFFTCLAGIPEVESEE